MIRNVVVVSDIHAGCQLGLCPPRGVKLDDGGTYHPSDIQKKLWSHWKDFWDWVKIATKGESFAIVVNGDAIDGVHHNSTTQITHNLEDQAEIAFQILEPIRNKAAEGNFYMVRGTEAHVGKSAYHEEALAKRLGAKTRKNGQYSHYKLDLEIGDRMISCLHHIGTAGSMAYETTALTKEMTEILANCALRGIRAPNIVVRSHRHQHCVVKKSSHQTYMIGIVTACWQLRTPFAWKTPAGRRSLPEFGGSVIRYGDRELFEQSFTRTIEDPEPFRI